MKADVPAVPQWQQDTKKAWAYMLLYWIVGWAVGFHSGNLSKLIHGAKHPIDVFATIPATLAFAVTGCIQAYINTRYQSFGRQSNTWGPIIFGVCNGTAETMLFLASYDVGRVHIGNILGCSRPTAIFLGSATFFVYTGLIHAVFWLRMVFPRHVRADAPAFSTHGLPALCLLSIVWLTLYEEATDDGGVTIVCMLHALVDTWSAMIIALPSPSFMQTSQMILEPPSPKL